MGGQAESNLVGVWRKSDWLDRLPKTVGKGMMEKVGGQSVPAALLSKDGRERTLEPRAKDAAPPARSFISFVLRVQHSNRFLPRYPVPRDLSLQGWPINYEWHQLPSWHFSRLFILFQFSWVLEFVVLTL